MLSFGHVDKNQKCKKLKSTNPRFKKRIVSRTELETKLKAHWKQTEITMTKNKKAARAVPTLPITECPPHDVWIKIKNWNNSPHRDWQPPVAGEPGCGTYRKFLTSEGKPTYFAYCPRHA